jgi:hypothetical protein
MEKKNENTRHAGKTQDNSGILASPRATLFTSALRNRYAERGQECSNFTHIKIRKIAEYPDFAYLNPP